MVQTVARAIEILRFLAEESRTLTEVANVLDVHKSTALRLLRTLENEGFARRHPSGSYVIGFGVIPLAERAIDQIDIRAAAHPKIVQLAAEIGHTVHLAQLIDGQIIYVDKVDGAGTVAMGSRVGLPTEVHTAAVAKVILCYLPDTERNRLIAGCDFRSYGPTTITALPAFMHELQLTRVRGWAEDDGEKEDYINCVALPIHDATGHVSMGMSVTALRAVAPLDKLRRLVPRLRSVADEISAELGWRRGPTGA